MPNCYTCDDDYTDDLDGWSCPVCTFGYCRDCYEDHSCRMDEDDGPVLEDDSENDQPEIDENEREQDFVRNLLLRAVPETKQSQEETQSYEMEEDKPKQPAARGLKNAIDEDYRKIGVATWNLHGLNDRRFTGEAYEKEIPNRLGTLGAAVDRVIAMVKENRARPEDNRKATLRKSTQRQSSRWLPKVVEEVPEPPVTEKDIAQGLAAGIRTFWQGVEGRGGLAKLNQAPAVAELQALIVRLQNLAKADCSVATATECIVLRTRVRRMVGTENGWKKGCSAELHARAAHPLCGVLDALVNLDQSLNTHLIIDHINQLMAKNPWLDAFILQEVRPGGLKVLEAQLDPSLRITFGPCMAGVAKTLNQREYYPTVTRKSTITKVTAFAIACVKNDWSEPEMPDGSKAEEILWPTVDDDALGLEVYIGPENNKDQLDTINILWSKECKVYRPVVVYELETEHGLVTIGNVHTSPGDGDDEWWRFHEYDQLEMAFEAAGQNGFWLMGGDYYLSAESRVQRSNADLSVTELDDDDTFQEIVDHFQNVTGRMFRPKKQGNKKQKLAKKPVTKLTVGQAQMGVYKAQSAQARPKDLIALETTHAEELQPFAKDFHQEITDTTRLDSNQASEDIFRNVLGLTFKRTLPDQWKIAQAISGTNTHLKIHDLPEYAVGASKVSLPCIERARRFTRARVTSKMRIADFFLFNQPWRKAKLKTSLACKIGLLAPVEVGSGCGIHWCDEENLAISRYWMALSDHFPVGGLFTTDPAEPALKKLTAAPFLAAPMKPRALPAVAPDTESLFKLVPMPQDGDCFFLGLKAALDLNEPVDAMRQYTVLEESKLPKVYVGWPDWEAVAKHYGISIVVHEYHYGHLADHFVGLLPEVNPHQPYQVHMRLIHIQDQSASHMDLMVPVKG